MKVKTPHQIWRDPELNRLLHVVIDDIGKIYLDPAPFFDDKTGKPDERSTTAANETFWLLVKTSLTHGETFKLITRYVGNGGNPLILARWLHATGSLNRWTKVSDAAGILKRLGKNKLHPAEARDGDFPIWQWTHKKYVPAVATNRATEDDQLFGEAIQTLYGHFGNAARNCTYGRRVHILDDSRWKRTAFPEGDMFGFENKMF